ncbi:MAG TPA: hypothetical protein VF244_02820 [Acidimicrobiales bacterium]
MSGNSPGSVAAHQWRDAAIVLRQHAAKFDELAEQAARRAAAEGQHPDRCSTVQAVLAIHRCSLEPLSAGPDKGRYVCRACRGGSGLLLLWPCPTAQACGVTE